MEADPYPAYTWLREHAPVHRTTRPSGVEALLVTRFADVRQALASFHAEAALTCGQSVRLPSGPFSPGAVPTINRPTLPE